MVRRVGAHGCYGYPVPRDLRQCGGKRTLLATRGHERDGIRETRGARGPGEEQQLEATLRRERWPLGGE
jgi:hypothetical protein